MTLKEELEILRGEPIQVFTGDPLDIPCIETSDPEKLCKHPVVSVHMITYNHEPYIRQAIEGVMMQQTDFEFELLIGEDCSTDKTREICFEYQKRYPDKIRVLWSEKNLYRNPHPAGGNSKRVSVRCRGEFIAICEGDDYWIDPLKLQKQVDVMRRHTNVGICFCGSKIYHGATDVWEVWNDGFVELKPGLIPSKRYLLYSMFGVQPHKGFGCAWFQMTATFLVRATILREAKRHYDLFDWRLRVGDGVLSMGCGSLSDAYYLPDVVSVYRRMPTGASTQDGIRGYVDTLTIRAYYWREVFGLGFHDIPERVRKEYVSSVISCLNREQGCDASCKYVYSLFHNRQLRRFVSINNMRLKWFLWSHGCGNALTDRINGSIGCYVFPLKLSKEYRKVFKMSGGWLCDYPILRKSLINATLRKLRLR